MFFPISCRETGSAHTQRAARVPALLWGAASPDPPPLRCTSLYLQSRVSKEGPGVRHNVLHGRHLGRTRPQRACARSRLHPCIPVRASGSGEERLGLGCASWRRRRNTQALDYPHACATSAAAQPGGGGLKL